MNLSQLLTISFECFPPKTAEGIQHLSAAVMALVKCNPHFFSVTFGAGGATREGTVETVSLLQKITKRMMVPHLSCVGSNRAQIIEILDIYKSMGVKRLIALRGDFPSGMRKGGELEFASDLITHVREVTGDYFHIDVAAYPEIHPQAINAASDILNLKRKYEAGANSAITQYFYNPDAYFYLLDDCVRHGINMPIIPGIMPIVHFDRLARFSDACGAEIPRWIRKRLEAYADDAVSTQAFGLEIVHHLCQSLIAGGAPGLHFYTLNRAEAIENILNVLFKERVAKARIQGMRV
jgi:methylenetetrahydrofolate reductase (NADPH)